MSRAPLEGIRVLDLGQIYNGAYAGFLLAMAGADVIKLEPVKGETLRRGVEAQTPLSFAMLNSSKRAITLDLKKPRGRELFLELVRHVDVVSENFAPGVLARLGLDYETIRAANPRIIYAQATGYGTTGPDRDQLAMDHTIQASSGMMSVTGFPDGPPTRSGGAPIDILGGAHLYAAITTALLRRELHGEGSHVEIAMQDAMYFALSSELAIYHQTGRIPERNGNRSPATVTPYGVYPCRDGWIALICVTETHWRRLVAVMDRSELLEDPRFKGHNARRAHEDLLNETLSGWTRERSRQEVFEALRTERIPVAPVRDLEEVRTDPHLHERGMLRWMEHPHMGRIVLPSTPIRFAGHEPDLRFFPALGEHNDEVYGELLGLDPAARAKLRDEGVI